MRKKPLFGVWRTNIPGAVWTSPSGYRSYDWTRRLLAVLGLLVAASSSAADGLPAEVADFLERRELCEHFRQEPWPEGRSPEDQERRDFIAAQFERYCRGSDLALREMKKKYDDDRAVMRRLGRYESDIEGK